VIGLSAEVKVCRQLCRETDGLYGVILDDCHFKDLLFQQVEPPPAARTLESSLVKMGFPHHTMQSAEDIQDPTGNNARPVLSFCMW